MRRFFVLSFARRFVSARILDALVHAFEHCENLVQFFRVVQNGFVQRFQIVLEMSDRHFEVGQAFFRIVHVNIVNARAR